MPAALISEATPSYKLFRRGIRTRIFGIDSSTKNPWPEKKQRLSFMNKTHRGWSSASLFMTMRRNNVALTKETNAISPPEVKCSSLCWKEGEKVGQELARYRAEISQNFPFTSEANFAK